MSKDGQHEPTANGAPTDRGLRLRMAGEARRVHSQHVQLARLFEELRRTFEERPGEASKDAFGHFADAFDAHMRLEETMYFPALHGLLPEVDADLSSLIDEHRSMRAAAQAIRDQLQAGNDRAAITLLDTLAEQRAQHEKVEEGLIERVRHAAERTS